MASVNLDMNIGIQEYMCSVFRRYDDKILCSGFNSVPSPGKYLPNEGKDGDGFDELAAGRLGYVGGAYKDERRGKWIPGDEAIVGVNKNRVQGICCGITTAWLVSFVNNVIDSYDCTKFESYLATVLRFQGAYAKDAGDEMFQHENFFQVMMSGIESNILKCRNIGLSMNLPYETLKTFSTWGGYVFTCGHVIGIGYRRYSNKYYIMDPLLGLFEYKKIEEFHIDLKQYLSAIWQSSAKLNRNVSHGHFPANAPVTRTSNQPLMDINFYYPKKIIKEGRVKLMVRNWPPKFY